MGHDLQETACSHSAFVVHLEFAQPTCVIQQNRLDILTADVENNST